MLTALLLLLSAAPPDPPGLPPPPPLLVEDPADPAPADEGDAAAPPAEAPPPAFELPPDTKAPAAPPAASWLPRGVRGGLGAAAGAGLGAAAGASFLFWGTLTAGTPELVLLLGAVATPALSAFLAGAGFIALAIDRPIAEDWAAVAGCTAVGCLALGLIAIGAAGGGLGSIGTGCNVPSSCCGNSPGVPGSTSSMEADEGAVWATAAGGMGAALGLGLGAGIGWAVAQAEPGLVGVQTVAWSAGAGMLLGALVGGAAGGAAGGAQDDDSVARDEATRPGPGKADRPR